MKAELVFNLDEVDMSKPENRKPKKVFIPKPTAGETICHCVSRGVKHRAIVASITIAKESLTPYIVTLQGSEPLRKRLRHHGVRMGVDLVLKQRSKLYLDACLFFEYVNIIFLSCLTEPWGTEELETHGAVLLIDNCSSHMSHNAIAVLTRKTKEIIPFAPHTIHIFQMLNVVLFGALKKHATSLTMLKEGQTTPAFMIKVYDHFK
jgi:hypothetical protein